VEFLAPAKVNLTLRLKGRRDDGFHEIETRMVPISVFDRLVIELRDVGGLEFSCDIPDVPADESNLVVRATRLFCTEVGLQPHLRIHLEKGIPHGAGLGGGSSDAATTLLALNHLFETQLPTGTLVSLAADLGSDVPFFIHRSAAVCRGRGEIVHPEPLEQHLPLLLIKPPFGVATAWAYRVWVGAGGIPEVNYETQRFPWGELHNDLERPVFEKYIVLAALKMWLLAQPETIGALMSGSGSTIFAVLRDREDGIPLGERLAEQFGRNLWCFLCDTLPAVEAN
jgi:4-diphosphocytidyl-2-C-methyl-D-erythritol kinase